jgi:flagellar biosynthesis anti-sigma factor FlgM
MRIPPETIRSLVGLHAQRVGKTSSVSSSSATSSVARSSTSGSLQLSDEATMLNTLKAGVKAMPDVDASRVQQVRDEISSGSFTVNPNQVAEGLVLELGGA